MEIERQRIEIERERKIVGISSPNYGGKEVLRSGVSQLETQESPSCCDTQAQYKGREGCEKERMRKT